MASVSAPSRNADAKASRWPGRHGARQKEHPAETGGRCECLLGLAWCCVSAGKRFENRPTEEPAWAPEHRLKTSGEGETGSTKQGAEQRQRSSGTRTAKEPPERAKLGDRKQMARCRGTLRRLWFAFAQRAAPRRLWFAFAQRAAPVARCASKTARASCPQPASTAACPRA